MRVMLTGATGFLGGHLLRSLAADGHALAILPRGGTTPRLNDPSVAVLTHDGSTRAISAALGGFAPHAVVHLASLYVSRHDPEDVAPLIAANLLFGTQVLQAMADHDVTRLINFGTSFQHYSGNDYNPVSLYAATKQAFEDLARYYVEAAGLRLLTLKLSDSYGPGDTRGKIIALLMAAARDGRTLELSLGEQLVNFVHADDVAGAVRVALARIETMATGTQTAFAVRGAENLSLRNLAALIADITGHEINVCWGARDYRPREVMQPWLGPLLPDWKPATSLREGLMTLNG